jgi:RNA polymerase sigma-70 factor (ECF subfamily)
MTGTRPEVNPAAAAGEMSPDPSAVADQQMMASIQAGSIAAFAALHDRYRDRVYRVARSVCRDEGRTQEAVQETFISIWRSRGTYVDRGDLAPWIRMIARHRAIDIARRNQPHAAHRADETNLRAIRAPGDVADQVMADGATRDLLSVLHGLPETQRTAITLSFYGQLTHLEIAAELAIPVGTVKGRIRLGMKRMRSEIERRDHAA